MKKITIQYEKMRIKISAYENDGNITLLAHDIKNGEFTDTTFYRVSGIKLARQGTKIWTKILEIPFENMMKVEPDIYTQSKKQIRRKK